MDRLLHGRAAELSAIRDGIAAAGRHEPTVIALVGEPGIGKTRLAREACLLATSAGFACAWGRAWEAGGAPGYWPWRLLFEAMPRVAPAGPLARLWGRQAGAEADDPEQARFELFDAVVAALRAAASETPLLCILEDLHAADLPSLELAAFATRQVFACPLLWIVTWRDAEAERAPARDLIARIAREARVLLLPRLSTEESMRLIDELAVPVPDAQRELLIRTTEGNPLFLVETLAVLAARGRTGLPAELDRLPVAHGVAAVVRERLTPLSPAARRVLEIGSVLGRELALETWAAAAAVPPDVLERRAAEIAATRILLEVGAGRWSFSHQLVREAIRRDVPEELARLTHGRVARALDERIRAGEPGLASERAHHALAALPELDAGIVIAWAISAAEAERARCAYEEALALLERTAAALGGRARRDGGLLLALGRACSDLGDVPAAREALLAAIEIARETGDPRLHALAVLAYGSRYRLGDILDELVGLIDEASGKLGQGEVDLRARLLARKAAALTPPRDREEVLGMAREALRLVAGSGNPSARLDVAVAAGSAFGDFAHPRERIPVNQEVVRLARAAGDRALELRGLSRLVTDHLEAGDLARADALLPERDALARSLKLPRFGWMEPLFRSMRAMPEGRFAVCREALEEAESLAASLGDANALRCTAVHRFWLLLLEDRRDELLQHEPRVLEALRSMNPTLRSIVRSAARLRAGDLRAAREEVDAIDPALPHGATCALALLAEVVAEVGPPELGREILKRLVPHEETNAAWGLFGLTCGTPIACALGMLAATLPEAAASSSGFFEAALERATAGGARAQRAWVRYAWGRALVGLGDALRGRDLLEEAASDARALGMDGLEARAVLARGPAAPAEAAIAMRQEGSAWLVERAGRSHLLPALRGMPMLARLLENPDVDIHALDLVSGGADVRAARGDAGELLDAEARSAYRRRVAALEGSIVEAEERGDADGVDAAREELEALRRELSRAVGRGGRVRRAGAAAERARVSAQRRIREAIRRIAEVDPALGLYLGRTVRTGMSCAFRPRLGNLPES
jgi:tetratricopeptide (TPR) repeat protein